MKKTLSSLLVIAMMVACATSSFAASSPVAVDDIPQDVVTAVGTPIGTHAEEDGYLIESKASTASGLPFSMRAIGVSGLLTTYSSTGKNFTGGAFDGFANEGLLIDGEVSHTLGYDVKVGACYYKAANDTFYSVSPLYFTSDETDSGFIPKLSGNVLNFSNSITYYGHITNHNSSGEVSGTLNFSVGTKAN